MYWVRLLPKRKPLRHSEVPRRRKVQAAAQARKILRMGRLFLKNKLLKSYLSRLRLFHLNPFIQEISGKRL